MSIIMLMAMIIILIITTTIMLTITRIHTYKQLNWEWVWTSARAFRMPAFEQNWILCKFTFPEWDINTTVYVWQYICSKKVGFIWVIFGIYCLLLGEYNFSFSALPPSQLLFDPYCVNHTLLAFLTRCNRRKIQPLFTNLWYMCKGSTSPYPFMVLECM